MGMIRIRVLNKSDAMKLKGESNLEKLDNMTDIEIHKTALLDQDAPLLSEFQLNKCRPFIFLKIKLKL